MHPPLHRRDHRAAAAPSSQQGFTIVEMVAALGILSIVVTAIAGVFYGAMRSAGASNRRADGVATAIRDVEAMHAIPWGQLGFDTQIDFEGHPGVVVSNPMITPTSTASFGGTTFNITRYIVWVDAPDNEDPATLSYDDAYKRVTAVVTWTHNNQLNTARQDSVLYPGGRGPYTGPQAASLTLEVTDTGTPAAPTGLSATVPTGVEGETSVDLTWTPPTLSVPLVDKWVIEYNANPGTDQWQSVTSDQPVTNTSSRVTDLASGKLYDFRVRSKAANGNLSTPSNVVQATTTSSNPAVCEAARLTINPTTVSRISGNSGHLEQDVVVTVNTLGPCSSLEVRYSPDTGVSKVAYMTASGSVWTGTLPKDQRWSVGNHAIGIYAGSTSTTAIAVGNLCVTQTKGSKC